MSNDTVIRVENLGKQYQLGTKAEGGAAYKTIREDLGRSVQQLFKRKHHEIDEFWALENVSFEVHQGDVLGIIGRNGAGKSTLLKILSRITEPTIGKIHIKGRVASLLEVGTGFHHELTGRENIFLNGAILGMSRAEIKRKFDEIVAFAEIERFLDTPVKRYSSGMYVRLAFAVAAHLEPEILVIDEVLAVGDSEFQKKCLGKMEDVSRGGRTVIFVSHNMGTVTSLCRTALSLDRGRVVAMGPAADQVSQYLLRLRSKARIPLEERRDREGDGAIRATYVELKDQAGNAVEHAFSGHPLNVTIGYRATRVGSRPVVAISCFAATGEKIFHCDNQIRGVALAPLAEEGGYTCGLARLPLPAGHYHINLMFIVEGVVADHVRSAFTFEVLEGDYFGNGRAAEAGGGMILTDYQWY
jgi:lipopolysaccharide transport system ATP-binding protein